MDKRFILIFIIIIMCVFNLFIIAEYSDVIGTASVDVSKYSFSLPKDFTLLNNDQNGVSIYNSKSGLHVAVSVIPHYNSTFKFNELNNNSNYTILSNGTINNGNTQIESIYYNTDNNKDNSSAAIFYFKKNNASFKISMDNFNYSTQRNETIDSVLNIVDTLRINYKI